MPIPNIVFFDLETRKLSSDFPDKWGKKIPSWLDPEAELTTTNILKMEFGVACTYDNNAIKFWEDPMELLLYLMSAQVDAICTFNGERFDFGVLIAAIDPECFDEEKMEFSESFKEAYQTLGIKSIDILAHIERVLGHRVSLENIAIAFDDTKKVAKGTDFWKLFNSSDLAKKVLATNYLLDDVIKLQKIYAIVHEFGMLAYRDNLGNTKKFNIKLPSLEDLKK